MRILDSKEPNWFSWKLEVGLHSAEDLGSQKLRYQDEVCHSVKIFSCAQSESPVTPGSSVGRVGKSVKKELLKVGFRASFYNNLNHLFHIDSKTFCLQAKSSLV